MEEIITRLDAALYGGALDDYEVLAEIVLPEMAEEDGAVAEVITETDLIGTELRTVYGMKGIATYEGEYAYVTVVTFVDPNYAKDYYAMLCNDLSYDQAVEFVNDFTLIWGSSSDVTDALDRAERHEGYYA
jgi:hypothetical protein